MTVATVQVGSRLRTMYEVALTGVPEASRFTDMVRDPLFACVKAVRRQGLRLSINGYGFHGTRGEHVASILNAQRLIRGPRALASLYAVCVSSLFDVAYTDYANQSAPFGVVFGVKLLHYVKNVRPKSPSKYCLAHEAWLELDRLYFVWNDRDEPEHDFIFNRGSVGQPPRFTRRIETNELPCNWDPWL